MPRSPQPSGSPGARKPHRAEPPSPSEGRKGYTTREVADALGLPSSRILGWARSGLLAPQKGAGGAYLFSFQDIVLLRAARELLAAHVPARRVKAALDGIRAQLPRGRPLSAVHLSAWGDRILVRDEGRVWEPDTGQLSMDLSAAAGETAGPAEDGGHAEAVDIRPAQTSVVTADDWYDAGVDLEAVSVDEAVAAYRLALEQDPEHPDAHLNLGRLLHEAGKLAEAEAHYRAAAAADPEGARAHYNLGVALEDQGRRAQAVTAYRKAIYLDGRLAPAHFNLSRLYEASGQEADALSHLATYRRLLARGEGGG